MGYYTLNNELYHHGIKGMKWGVRRFQNPDGTLTTEGKNRYLKIENGRTQLTKEGQREYSSTLNKNTNYVQGKIQQVKNKYKNELNKLSEDVQNSANRYGKEYQQRFKELSKNEKFKEDILKSLYDDFGVGADDEDFFDMVVGDHIYEKAFDSKYDSKSLIQARNDYNKATDNYWNKTKEMGQEVFEAVGDVPFKGNYSIESGKDAISSHMGDSFTSYINRHFDDYWVIDTKEFNDLQSSISMDDYNQWAKKQK